MPIDVIDCCVYGMSMFDVNGHEFLLQHKANHRRDPNARKSIQLA
jgi:hypothetical protein